MSTPSSSQRINDALIAQLRSADPQLWNFLNQISKQLNSQINATSSSGSNVSNVIGPAYWVRVDPFTITPANLGDFVRITSTTDRSAALEFRFEDPNAAIFSYNYNTQGYDFLIIDGKALSLNGVSLGPVGLGILPDSLNLDTWMQIAACDAFKDKKRANLRFNNALVGLPMPKDGSFEYINSILYYTVGSTRYQIAPTAPTPPGNLSIRSPYIYDGTNYYYNNIKCYPPGTLGLSSDNMGGSPTTTATIGTYNDIVLEVKGGSGTSPAGQKVAITNPSGSWTIDIRIIHNIPSPPNFPSAGMYMYDSNNGKVMTFGFISNDIANAGAKGSSYLWTGLYNNITSFNTDSLVRYSFLPANPVTLRVVNDGANLNFYISSDGYSFGEAMGIIAKGSWFSGSGYPTHAGFYGTRAGTNTVVTVLSYKQS